MTRRTNLGDLGLQPLFGPVTVPAPVHEAAAHGLSGSAAKLPHGDAIQLSGGVGQAGDSYEQHADKVADAVVAGKSAEPLLDPFAGGGSGGVQRKVVQRIAVPDDIRAMTIDQCKEEAAAMFVGTDSYAQRGIIDHKIDAANDMRVDLERSDPVSLTTQIAIAVLTVGVAAGAAALSVGTLGVGAALIAAGGAAITALPGFFQGGGNELDSTDFVSNYISTVRQGWPQAVTTLYGQMTDEASARQTCAATRALRDNASRVKQIPREEILDEWMSASARVHGGGGAGRGGMGETSYRTPTDSNRIEYGGGAMSEGRCHQALASYFVGRDLDADDMGLIDANWSKGLDKVWDAVKGNTLRELGISAIGNRPFTCRRTRSRQAAWP